MVTASNASDISPSNTLTKRLFTIKINCLKTLIYHIFYRLYESYICIYYYIILCIMEVIYTYICYDIMALYIFSKEAISGRAKL